MRYNKEQSFNGNPSAALAIATSTLTVCGFRIVESTDRSLVFDGPPGMHCARQHSPLTGASRIHVMVSAGRIALDAEVSGGQLRSRLPVVLTAGSAAIALVITNLYTQKRAAMPALAGLIVAVLVATAAALLSVRQMRSRTVQALDALLNNLAVAARHG
jgi:hypothetical protein